MHPIRQVLATRLAKLFLTATILFCYAREAQSNDIRNIIPVIIGESNQGCELSKSADLTSDTQEYLEQNPHERDPATAMLDIDGNGLDDYALLLKCPVADKKLTKFLIILQEKKDSYVIKHEIDFEINYDLFLHAIRPGQPIEQTDSAASLRDAVKLKNPAVELVYFGKAAVVYFWDNKTRAIEPYKQPIE